MIITPINSTESAVHLSGYAQGVSGGGTGLDTYGEFHDYGGGNTLALTTSYTEWQTGTAGNFNNMTLSSAPVKFTIDEKGIYKFDGSFAIETGTVNRTISAAIFINGAIYASSEVSRTFSGASTAGSFSITTFVDLNEGDEVAVEFKADAAVTITIINISTNMLLIGPDGTSGAGSATVKDIWPVSLTTSRINIPESLRIMSVSSSNSNDAEGGSGAQVISIGGIDRYQEIRSEIIKLNGQTEVKTQFAYTNILNVDVVETGSSGSNEGVIYVGSGTVTAGVPATPYFAMREFTGSAETLCFAVPEDYEFTVEHIYIVPKTLATTSFNWNIEEQTVAPFYSKTPTQQKRVLRYSGMYRGPRHSEMHFGFPMMFRAGKVFTMSVSDLNSSGDIIANVKGKLKYIGTDDT
jgi:hypothetical protein